MLQTMLDKFNLVELQNHPANVHADVLSFCELFQTEEQFKLLADRLQARIDKGDQAMYAIFSLKTKKQVTPWFTTKAMCWAEAMSRGYVVKGLRNGQPQMINHYFGEV